MKVYVVEKVEMIEEYYRHDVLQCIFSSQEKAEDYIKEQKAKAAIHNEAFKLKTAILNQVMSSYPLPAFDTKPSFTRYSSGVSLTEEQREKRKLEILAISKWQYDKDNIIRMHQINVDKMIQSQWNHSVPYHEVLYFPDDLEFTISEVTVDEVSGD